jgi:hypothetical protein
MSPRREILTSFQVYRDLATSKDAVETELPRGWTRDTCSRSGKPIFRHQSDDSQTFWYPLPLRDSNADPPSIANFPYLHCHTRLAVPRFGSFFESRLCPCTAVNIQDSDGNWAGVLRLNFRLTNPHEDPNATLSKELSLIELSRGSVLDQPVEEEYFDEWRCSYWNTATANGKRYEFYNVMWVETKESISYRIAVGRVIKEK